MTTEEIIRPIGSYNAPEEFTEIFIAAQIIEIETLPNLLSNTIEGLTDNQLNTPYRDGGWTLKQVVHHIADSHLQAFTRFKLALTEENPTIKPYDQDAWVTTADVLEAPVQDSVIIVKHLHSRWVTLLKSMKLEDFSRTFYHPEQKKNISLAHIIGLYAWHGKHHSLQIFNFCKSQEWK